MHSSAGRWEVWLRKSWHTLLDYSLELYAKDLVKSSIICPRRLKAPWMHTFFLVRASVCHEFTTKPGNKR